MCLIDNYKAVTEMKFLQLLFQGVLDPTLSGARDESKSWPVKPTCQTKSLA